MKIWPFGSKAAGLSSVPRSRSGWFSILEPSTGAWQRNEMLDRDGVAANPFVFRCQSMIARDISKLSLRLMRKDGRVWQEADDPRLSSLLRKPNHFQTANQFWENWILSKLMRGNTYALKQRDQVGHVIRLYVLDTDRVAPLVSESGDVYYQLSDDNLSGLKNGLVVPASEIIHDRWNCLFHPLVGISPLWAVAVAATQSQNIQESSASFFANQARPCGVLSAPGKIDDSTAQRLKEAFEQGYSGKNAGRIAVVGDGLSFTPLNVTAHDAQLVEQLKWTAETIASVFGIPLYKVGLGPLPSNDNLQALNIEYYSQALQGLIEDAESCVDAGLDLDDPKFGVAFDVDNLWRMDSATQMEVLERGKSVMTLDERRERLNLKPVEGGGTIYLQQQDHSIEAIAARDRVLIEGADEPDSEAKQSVSDPVVAERAFQAELLLSMRKSMEAT